MKFSVKEIHSYQGYLQSVKEIHSQSRKSTIKGIQIKVNAVKETRLVEALHWGLKVNGTWTMVAAADNQIFDKISVT